ncbi:translation initiation factor IF-3 [Lewinella aquimaris]|uniref:Translation initiation factor IF-3 n=1 Tax=Neolewinella aquimaris TaxID=1835722 RepID=A0A840DYW7_9BACT|nr:translation initiation factor IF-3 [Neolewinella aquimaris]MBB4078181.1 translation initiation factor IF-3 [Neolewinella aquimaris]
MAKRRGGGRNRYTRREEPTPQFRINDMIRVPEVRLVGDNLEQISEELGTKVESGVYDIRQLKGWGRDLGLDLVEISPNASPPVVRMTDYKKFLYEKKRKEKEIRSKAVKTVIKEVRFGPNTDDHDFDFKVRHARGFLEDGAKVKAYVHFRGRSIVFKDRGELLLLRFMKELEDLGAAEAMPKMEGRRMNVIISPKKVQKKSKSKSSSEEEDKE